MNKKLSILLSSAILLASPMVILADFNPGGTPNTVVLSVTQIVNVVLDFIWPIFAGFAVIMFIVAGFAFLTSQGDPEKVNQARQATLWGVVGVVVALVAFSIPFIVRVTLGSGI